MLYVKTSFRFFCQIVGIFLLLIVSAIGNGSSAEHPEVKRFMEIEACGKFERSADIFPDEFKNVHLGMEESTFKTQRPNAKASVDYRVLSEMDSSFLLMPAIFSEVIQECMWENAYFTIFKERLSELKFVTFKATSKEKYLTLRRLIEVHGKPDQKCIKYDQKGIYLIWNTADCTIEVSAANVINNKTSFILRVVAKGHEQLLSTTKEYLDTGQRTEELESLEQNLFPQLKDLVK